MPTILYLTGCQGSGKTILAERIAAGSPRPTVIVSCDEAGPQPNLSRLRALHPDARCVIVEGCEAARDVLAQLRGPDQHLALSRAR